MSDQPARLNTADECARFIVANVDLRDLSADALAAALRLAWSYGSVSGYREATDDAIAALRERAR